MIPVIIVSCPRPCDQCDVYLFSITVQLQFEYVLITLALANLKILWLAINLALFLENHHE